MEKVGRLAAAAAGLGVAGDAEQIDFSKINYKIFSKFELENWTPLAKFLIFAKIFQI
ncbi:MAG: hypothetical protein LBS61_03775 [Endomicrobium sp.]|nr:hypothetical protein [Endomicrobium sp.]